MGWVRKRIEDHQKIAASLTPLWNNVRDAIGDAVLEFKSLVPQPSIDHGDCRARGSMCVRVRKPGAFIEVFLSPSDEKIKTALGTINLNGETESPQEREICGYRLREDRSGLEFYTEDRVVSASDVVQLALEDFLLNPFPTAIRV